jgi:hypothetical protein
MARMLLDTAPSAAPGFAAAAAAAQDTAAGTQQAWQHAARRHWAAALPERVPLTFAHASEAQLRGVGDEGLADEALAVRQLMLDSHEVRRLHGCAQCTYTVLVHGATGSVHLCDG